MQSRDYAQQVMGSQTSSRSRSAAGSSSSGVLERASVSSSLWASLDVSTVLIASIIALRFRLDVSAASGVIMNTHVAGALWSGFGAYMVWFALCLVFFTRSYGLHGSIQSRSGLNEQRLTLQATLVAGLILCGTLG